MNVSHFVDHWTCSFSAVFTFYSLTWGDSHFCIVRCWFENKFDGLGYMQYNHGIPAWICGVLKRLLGFEFPGESCWSCDQNNVLHMTWLTASLQATLEATNVVTATGKALTGYAFKSICTKNSQVETITSSTPPPWPGEAGWLSVKYRFARF